MVKVTHFLSEEEFDSKKLWKLVKSAVREKETEDGAFADNYYQTVTRDRPRGKAIV